MLQFGEPDYSSRNAWLLYHYNYYYSYYRDNDILRLHTRITPPVAMASCFHQFTVKLCQFLPD